MAEGRSGSEETARAGKKQRDRNGRKNAATACDVCRRRRIRCLPAEEPDQPCKACSAGSIACTFTGSDKRKENMQELRAKLSQFESLFSSLSAVTSQPTSAGCQLPTLPEPVPALEELPFSEASIMPDEFPVYNDHDQRGTKRQRLSSSAQYDNDTTGISPIQTFFASPSGSSASNPPKGGSPTSLLRPLVPTPAGSAGVPVVMDRLTLEAGEIRAYGPTSNQTLAVERHVSHEAEPHRGDARMQAPPDYQYEPFERMSLLVSAANNISSVPLGTDIRTIEHLLVNYFIWHHAMFPVTSCRLFLDHFRDGGRYCSPLLLNAMLALASHLVDWKLARADPNDASTTGATFFAQARSLLDEELESPSVTTVQSLCLMAKYEAYNGRALKGGLYIAMCGRLVLDLGLHLDPTHLVDKGLLPAEAAWMRSRAFWGVWSVDKEFSALVGRPSAIRGVLINCPKPSYWAAEDFDWALSYQKGRLFSIGADPSRGIYHIADLAIEMAGVHLNAMELLYWRENKPSLEENTIALEASMAATAEAMSSLPDISGAAPSNPHHATLHMVYSCHKIILNRPFLFASGFKTGNASSPARDRCFQSAREIVRLMAFIRDATPNGLRTTLNCHQHNLITAASILILELTPRIASRERVAAVREDLSKIFSMLETMATFRPAAKQALDNLRDLHQTTETQTTLASMATGDEGNRSQARFSQQHHDPLLIGDAQLDQGMFAFGDMVDAPDADFNDLSDFDTFLAQQQSYLYPTLSCSNLFDINGFFQTQLLQSRPNSPRNGRTD